jgi:heat shock protein HtpX
MFLRIVLFLAANFGVLIVLSTALRVLGLDAWLAQQGMPVTSLLVMAVLIGFGGSFISLAMSKWMAKTTMGVQVIDTPQNATERWLVETVARQAEAAGIGMPEVGIFPSDQPNAFATGMNKNDALVAVSTGLLANMNADEVEAVLGHEVSHVANGDMVTMALLQGVLNTFVIFLSRVIGTFVDRVVFGNREGLGVGYWVTSIVAEIFLGVLATIIAMWFSRRREFRADAGGAQLAGKHKMIDALRALQRAAEPRDLPGEMAAFGIVGGIGHGLKKLFMSHPPIEERIAALQRLSV